MAARRLILLRHGETVWNVEQRVQGQSCSGLTARGEAQAERAAAALAARWPDAVLVSSDLPRCLATSAPLEAALARPLHAAPVLRERAFGRWEGWSRVELEAQDPERYRRWKAGEEVLAEIGAETDEVLRTRASAAFATLLGLPSPLAPTPDATPGAAATPVWPAEVQDAGTIIAVSHGGTILQGLGGLLGFAPARLGAVANASISELSLGGPGPGGAGPTLRLVRFNETAHLA